MTIIIIIILFLYYNLIISALHVGLHFIMVKESLKINQLIIELSMMQLLGMMMMMTIQFSVAMLKGVA